MPTPTQISRLRADTGTNATSLPDAEDILNEAAEAYSDSASYEAYARVLVFQRLMAQAAARTDYKQNQSAESLSDLIKNFERMLKLWEGKLESAVGIAAGGAIRLGKSKRVPSRLKEYPDG